MIYLASYDIQQDSLRVKLSKTFIRHGLYRMQYSVFLGELKDSTFNKLSGVLQQFEQSSDWSVNDSVLVIPLHQYSEDNIEWYGSFPQNWGEITGKIHTLIL